MKISNKIKCIAGGNIFPVCNFPRKSTIFSRVIFSFLLLYFFLNVPLLYAGADISGQGKCPQPRKTKTAPEKIYTAKNPLKPTPEILEEGESLYHFEVPIMQCEKCHGKNGNGFGMMAWSLRPKPRNFLCKKSMSKVSDGQIFWIIKNGSKRTGCLPNRSLSDDQIWKLVLYVRELSK
ncbi:MAG: c-type cytochrome [Nitrospinae bacterium]|nr:c-type cytochrome [Nitrospinota bacterium]